MRLLQWGLATVIYTAAPAVAGCGLQLCSIPMGGNDAAGKKISARTDFQYAEFAFRGITGHYFRTNLRGEFTPSGPWKIGANIPIVALDSSTGNHTGLGNPVIFAEYAIRGWNELDINGGLQFEIPAGGDDHGIGSDHLEFLPYVSAAKRLDPAYLYSHLGLRLSASDDHGGSGKPPVLVDPHEDQEILLRLGAGSEIYGSGFVPEVFLDGQKALDGTDAGKTFVTAGVSVKKRVAGLFELTPLIELPLSSPKRLQWRAGLTAQGRF